ncbi:MAG: metallophosphatase domain-containing protein [Bacteroidota bacterium]
MRFILISDTYGLHRKLQLPEGDVIIHAGDFCGPRSERDSRDFLKWFSSLPYSHKIFIGGNHDFFAARNPRKFNSMIPKNVIYLNDSGAQIGNLNIWGSPVQPDLEGWAFGKRRGEEMRPHWDLIPPNTDVLITHTPPNGILDKSRSGSSLGCEDLSAKLLTIKPRLHVFGHIHASNGRIETDATTYINASNYNSNLGLVNKAAVFTLNKDQD